MKSPIISRRHRVTRAVFQYLSAAAISVSLTGALSAQTLLHRYSFASDATDSVGGANGTLVAPNGGAAASINNGLNLPGSGGGFGNSGYVSLPSGILTNTSSVTIECWMTQNSQNTWATPWDFGNNGSQNFALIPYPGNNNHNMEVAFTPNGNERDLQTSKAFPSGSEQYVTVTVNSTNLEADIYTNAVLDAKFNLPNSGYLPGQIGGAVGTTENMLGNDVYGDPQFNGTIYELRIWKGVVSQRYLAASAIAGPSVVINNLNPTSVKLNTGPSVVLTGTEQANVTVELSQTGTNDLPATGDVTNWVSGNTNILKVNSTGLISGVGLGTTTISATIAGTTVTSGNITVTPQALQHRYSFVSDATDSVGGANGTVVAPNGGAAATISNGLILPGSTTAGNGVSGYVSLPNGIIASNSSITIECWVTQNSLNTWAEIWDFGNNGSQNFALIPASPTPNMRVAFTPNGGENDIVVPTLVTNAEQYVVVTYNNSSLLGSLYLNGALDGTAVLPNTSYSPGSYGGASGTVQNMLGNDVYGDEQFSGTIYEFRIWNGAVSPLFIEVSAAAGPGTVVGNLTPTSLTMNITNASLVGAQTEQASIVGNFADASGVNVTGGATNWSSSNPTILTVNNSGFITAQSGGSATVSAYVGGVKVTSGSITVQSTMPNITQQPAPVTTVVGGTATFTVSALGGNLTYQWDDNSVPIPGATNSTLVLSNLTLSQAGSITVVITNSLGSATSSPVALNVKSSILQHRYSFVSDATDSVGGANGTLIAPNGGGAASIANGLNLPGNAGGGNGVSGYLSLPNGIMAGDSSVSIECWMTANSQNTWAEIWDLGSSTTVNFALIQDSPTPNAQMRVAFTPHGNEQDIYAPAVLPTGSQQYVVVTYNNANLTGTLYLNGAFDASAVLPDTSYSPGSYGGAGGTTANTLGNDVWGDPQFGGVISEFRVWNGVLSPLYVAVSAAAGPGVVVTNLTPESVSVTVTNSTLVGGETEQAVAVANFQDASGVTVTGAVTNWTSANTSILTVNSNGVITAVGAGSTTIRATVAGTTGTSASITVTATPPIITQEPESSAVLFTGATLHASVANIGTGPFTYQWYFNSSSTPIGGATSSTLIVPNVQANNAGNYYCVIGNATGTTNSTTLALTVVTPNIYEATAVSLGAMSLWPLNEASGTTAYDVAGGYNGTYMGNVFLGVGGPTNAQFGANGTGAYFDGSSGYVDIPEGPFNITNAITVSAWVSLQSGPGFDDIVGHGDQSWRLSINPSGQPGANDGAPPADATSTSTVVDGNWHFVAFTWDGSLQGLNGVLYVDGVVKAYNQIQTVPAGDNLDVWIGGAPDYPGARMFPGSIADVAVFPRALTAAQVTGLYQGQVSLQIKASGSNVTLTWPAGTLLQATTLNGPWTTNAAAVSPYTVPANKASQFFRVVQ